MSQQAPAPSGPGRGGYVAAGLVLVLTVVAVVVLALTSIGGIRDSAIDPVSDSLVTVGDEQLAVYVRTTGGPVSVGTCSVTAEDGTSTPLDVPDASLEVQTWTRVGLTPETLPAGEYRLACDGAPASALGVGTNPPIASLVVRFLAALAVGGLGVTVALVLLIVTIVRRHRATPAR